MRAIDAAEFTLRGRRPLRRMGRPQKLALWQVSFLKRAVRLREQLTDKALARRLKCSTGTLHNYIRGSHKT